jgi:hypothetical protein
MVVTLPLVLLLLDYWPLRRSLSWRALVKEKIPLLAMAFVSCEVTLLVQRMSGAVGSLERYPFGLRVENALVSYVVYIRKMIWPDDLAVLYPYPAGGLPMWQVVGSAVLLLGVTLIALKVVRRHPYVVVGWLWYVVTLLPVIGLVQVGKQAMADRYTYIPLVGLFVIIAWGAPDLMCRIARGVSPAVRGAALAGLAGLWILGLATCARAQVACRRNDVTLWRHALAVTSKNAVAHNNLGTALAARGDIKGGIRHISEAVRIDPRQFVALVELGDLLLKQEGYKEAAARFSQALRVEPDYADARRGLARAMELERKARLKGGVSESELR